MKYIAKGALHLHSLYSDGTGTIQEIAQDAKKAGLDWIIITDHNTLAGLKNNEEGWYDGVAVIIGNEISPEYSNHYLTVGLEQEVSHNLNCEEIINQVKTAGGIGFVAHPDESQNRKCKYPPLRWEDWNIRGFNGIEIWNYMSDWTDRYNPKLGVFCALARHRIIKGPTHKTLEWWDKINAEASEIVSAVGGLDSHAFNFGLFKIFPYFDTFKTITNYLYLDKKLSSDFTEAKQQVLNALKTGNNIIVNRFLNKKPDNDLKFYINEEKKLIINLPQKGKIRILKDGKILSEKSAKTLTFSDLHSGKYRFEAYYKNRPWIFSNPILVK